MVQITYTLRLDMRDTGIVNTSLRLKQGDSGMKIAVNVFNGGVSAFDSSTTPKIVFRRPDGASVMADMTVESSLYSYTLVGNELQVPGKELIDIKFPIGAEGRESTMSCSIEVVPDTITPNTHGSGIYDNDLAELVEEATEAAETVQEVVGDSEAWANGERNGVPVGPEDPAYHNNSKYWSEQANPTALANLTDVDVDGVVNGDVLQYNSSTQKWEGKSISSGTNEIIAPVEGATSLHAYAVGKQLIYNDTLYKVIAPIAVNDALVVNTNIEVSPKTVIEQVEDNKEDIEEMMETEAVLGAGNFFNYICPTMVHNGVTYTNNNNGTVTVNGTVSEGMAQSAVVGGTLTVTQNMQMILNGAQESDDSKFHIYVWDTTANARPYTDSTKTTPQTANCYGTGANAEIPFYAEVGHVYTLYVRVSTAGTSVTNKTFYPKIRVATDKNASFTPHAKTNRELTEGAAKTTSIIIDGTIVKTDRTSHVYYDLINRTCTFDLQLTVGTYANYSNFVTGLPRPKSANIFPCVCLNNSRNIGIATLTDSGTTGQMYFTGLSTAPNFVTNDQITITGSYIISDAVTS